METIPATNLDQPGLGYVLLALLSDNARKQITDLSNGLKEELPGILWTMPPQALHITLCEIIQPKDYGQDKDDLYRQHAAQYELTAREILSGIAPIRVRFDSIEASASAIIVRGTDDGTFNNIRSQLIRRMPLPAGTKLPPDIIHSSIARYTTAAGVEDIQRVLARHQITFDEEVRSFTLARTTVQPMLKYETLKTYALS